MAKWANTLLIIAIILVVIGGLVWGWVGITSNNLVSTLNNATFRNQTMERGLYVIIGIAAIYVLVSTGRIFNAINSNYV